MFPKLIASLLLALPLAAQPWAAPPPSGYPAINTFLGSLIAANAGSGAPTSTCTTGKDLWINTSSQAVYFCASTNNWLPVASTILGPGSSNPGTCTVGQIYFNTGASP